MDSKVTIDRLLNGVSQSWSGDTLKSYPTGSPKIIMSRVTVPPHTRMEPHSHSVMNIGYILQGELTINTMSGESMSFGAGSPAVEMVNREHYGENRGDEDLVLIVVTLCDENSQVGGDI